MNSIRTENRIDSSSIVFQVLGDVIRYRLNLEFKNETGKFPATVDLSGMDSELGRFIMINKLTFPEVVCLFLALVPHLSPGFLSGVVGAFLPNGGDFPEFGGVKGRNHRGIIPTGETVLFILAGKDAQKRAGYSGFFDEAHLFAQKNVLYLDRVPAGEPLMSGKLVMDDEYVDLFTTGKISKPKLSSDFPAQLITTEMEWSDLVLHEKTMDEIREIEIWLQYNDKLMDDWKLRGKVKPGYRVLFHGPPGTGKTMTACLLGKYTGRDVFRIDLSMVISKYLGETEKNLSKLFDKAANKNWILFFDEADALFGKRTGVRDAHDKYANQEVSYLLQRVEAYGGLVILASNMKANIDQSFTRRFNSFVEFENPGVDERQKLWENYLPENAQNGSETDLHELARNYELSGANIVNAIQFAGLQTLRRKRKSLDPEDLLKGIQKEYQKEGKMLRKN